MEVNTITAEERDQLGKGSSRATRREKRVPAVIYGKKFKNKHISFITKEVTKLVEKEGFMSKVLDITVGDKTIRTIPRDVQFHPVKDSVQHLDLLNLEKGATINVMIPLHFIGEDKCPGIKKGGILNAVRREIELLCDIDHIPSFIEIDVSSLEIGGNIHIHDIELPKETKPVIDDRDFTIVTIAGRSAEEPTESVEVETEEENGNGENGEKEK